MQPLAYFLCLLAVESVLHLAAAEGPAPQEPTQTKEPPAQCEDKATAALSVGEKINLTRSLLEQALKARADPETILFLRS